MDMYIKTAPNKTAIDNWLKNVNLIKKREPHVPMDMSVKMAQKQNWYQIAALVQKNGNHLNDDDLFSHLPRAASSTFSTTVTVFCFVLPHRGVR